ncbi:MAG: hypothetical protein ACRYGC_16340 [Janthinobacterium lividum]
MSLAKLARFAVEEGSEDGLALLGEGWCAPEGTFVWASGETSTLSVPVGGGHAAYVLVLGMGPVPRRRQRITVWSDGHLLGMVLVRGAMEVTLHVPAALVVDGLLALTIVHRDCMRPSDLDGGDDHRVISVWLRDVAVYGTPLVPPMALDAGARETPRQLVSQFQSVGDNCEFGVVQRQCGAEPLNLLRFASTDIAHLLRGLATQFAGLDEPENVTYRLGGERGAFREYVMWQTTYDLVYHTYKYQDDTDADTLLAAERQKLGLQLRMFLEDLEDAEKILVIKRNDPLALGEVLPVLRGLRAYGDNTLLYVVPAGSEHLPGSVEWKAPGLLCGYMDRFAPYEDAHDTSMQCWLSICRNALGLWRSK